MYQRTVFVAIAVSVIMVFGDPVIRVIAAALITAGVPAMYRLIERTAKIAVLRQAAEAIDPVPATTATTATTAATTPIPDRPPSGEVAPQ